MTYQIQRINDPSTLTTLSSVYEEIFPHFTWSDEALKEALLSDNQIFLGAFLEDELVGIFQGSYLFETGEVYNIGVIKPHRKKGVAEKLLLLGIQTLSNKGTEEIFLEVRESNIPARNLYEKVGFQQISQRKNYYQKPAEDAYIYQKNVKGGL